MFFKRNKNRPREVDSLVARVFAKEWSTVPTNTDHWVKYLEVLRPHPEDMNVVDVRIYDEWEADQKRVKVTDYSSLDQHQDVVQFEGWFNRKTKESEVKYRKAA